MNMVPTCSVAMPCEWQRTSRVRRGNHVHGCIVGTLPFCMYTPRVKPRSIWPNVLSTSLLFTPVVRFCLAYGYTWNYTWYTAKFEPAGDSACPHVARCTG